MTAGAIFAVASVMFVVCPGHRGPVHNCSREPRTPNLATYGRTRTPAALSPDMEIYIFEGTGVTKECTKTCPLVGAK